MTARSLLALVALALLLAACSGDSASAGNTAAPTRDTTSTTNTPTTTSTTTSTSTTTTSTTTSATTTTTMPPPVAITEFVDIEVGGEARRYRLHVPEGLPGGAAYPLVLDFHGLTAGPESQNDLSGMSQKADEEGFIVATPEASGIGSSWGLLPGRPETGADIEFAIRIVADIGDRLPVDPSRVYATGFSNGGGFANRLACDEAETFAAIGSVSGAYPSHTDCANTEPVPVVAFHGSNDFVVPFGGLGDFFPPITDWAAAWAVRNGCPGDPQQERVAEDVIRVWWEDCPAGADVELHAIEGGAHGWPGSTSTPVLLNSTDTISATDLIWDFFESR